MTQQCTESSHQFNVTEDTKITSAYNLPSSLSFCQDCHIVWHKSYHYCLPLVLEELCNRECWNLLIWEAYTAYHTQKQYNSGLVTTERRLQFSLTFFLSLSQDHKNNLHPLFCLNITLFSLWQTGVVPCLSLWLTHKTLSSLMANSSCVQRGGVTHKRVVFEKHIAFSQWTAL